jgi:hypothetical protein
MRSEPPKTAATAYIALPPRQIDIMHAEQDASAPELRFELAFCWLSAVTRTPACSLRRTIDPLSNDSRTQRLYAYAGATGS